MANAHIMDGNLNVTFTTGPVSCSSDVTITPGSVYVVKPENAQKLKHRGRVCKYVGLWLGICPRCGLHLSPDAARLPTDAARLPYVINCARCGCEVSWPSVRLRVRFADNGRLGAVDPSDLVPIS